MTDDLRWRDRSSVFVPPARRFDPHGFEVAPIDESSARAFVVAHHYSASYPAARRRMGLYRHGELMGVAVFSHPCSDVVLTSVFPGKATDSVELGRFVLLDEVGFNGETWFLARAFEWLRTEGIRGVVSFSDPMPRKRASGEVVFAGHVGQIYQAHNATYLGQAPPRSIRLLPDGRVVSARALSKIRARERGFEYAVAQIIAAGTAIDVCVPPVREGEDARAWLTEWLPAVSRTVRHPGNHKYAWKLNRRAHLPPSLIYPRLAA